ncbi:hypothetical protein HanIR_Chr08g0364521 [Helianthus annuus]|nr:hypothetical protein HanIR_Chr08g0364521 [Helianthus annuus]
MANKANRSPPHRIASPPHARLQTPAPLATPQPKPPGWWLGRIQPTHAPTQAPYPIV